MEKNKTNELRDIEIEDLKNHVFTLNKNVSVLSNILLDTLGAKNLRQIMYTIVEAGVDEDDEEFVVLAEESILDVLLRTKQ